MKSIIPHHCAPSSSLDKGHGEKLGTGSPVTMAYTLPSSSRTDLVNLDKHFGTCPIGRSAMS